MPSEKVILDLVAQIYDAAVDPDCWQPFLKGFADVTSSEAAALFLREDNRSLLLDASFGIAPEDRLSYAAHYAALNVWQSRLTRQFEPGVVRNSADACPDAELLKTDFYNGWLRPQRLFYGYGGTILKSHSVSTNITAMRSRNRGAYDQAEVQLLQTLMLHLQKALELHRRVIILQEKRNASIESLNLLSTGFILVDRSAHVLFTNHAARRIIDQNDGLSIRLSGLTASLSDETAKIQKLAHEAWIRVPSNGSPSPSGSVAVSRPSGRRRFSLLVVPLPRNESEPRLFAGIDLPAAAILISDPEGETVPDTTALRQSFGLTPAEANLASILMAGKSLKQAMDQLRISMNTAKTQLKAIFSKTGTSRQGELIRLLLLGIAQLKTPAPR